MSREPNKFDIDQYLSREWVNWKVCSIISDKLDQLKIAANDDDLSIDSIIDETIDLYVDIIVKEATNKGIYQIVEELSQIGLQG